MELLEPDLCVIGGGSGGLSVAAAAAMLGSRVVLIEKDRLGGDCLYTGCVPSKALLAAARRVTEVGRSPEFGVIASRPRVDFAKARAHVEEVIAAIAPNDSPERFAGLGVRVISGTARFTARDTVTVGKDIAVKARRFVIATGARPMVPPIPGLDQIPFLTNETVFDLDICPAHLIVIGAGPVGLELAQAYRRLGAEVTVLEAKTPLAADDAECAEIVLDCLAEEGIVIRVGVEVGRVEPVTATAAPGTTATAAPGETTRVVISGPRGEEVVVGSHVLVAAGRRPAFDDLGLDAAGIRHKDGRLVLDRALRTSNKRVYAIGDAAGGPQFTHVASHHAGLVIRNALFRLPVRADERAIPRVTFTDPELAHTGLTEAVARLRHRRINVLRWPYHENDRARAERATRGHIKVVTTPGGRILGATIVGAQAGELITTWTLAIDQKVNIRAMAGLVVPYPTLAEIGKRAAVSYFTPRLAASGVRRLMAWLRRLG
jgi:pyruvate/2-oxoglutarate dehydrogenase complex dihydrolipoamide dehydrogenase (E3) component